MGDDATAPGALTMKPILRPSAAAGDEENRSSPRRRHHAFANILGSSRRFPHSNSPRRQRTRSGSDSKWKRSPAAQRRVFWEDEIERHVSWEDEVNQAAIAAVRQLPSYHAAGSAPFDDPRSGVHRRAKPLKATGMSDSRVLLPNRAEWYREMNSGARRAKDSATMSRPMKVLSFASCLALLGYFIEMRQVMNGAYQDSFSEGMGGISKEWLMTLPRSILGMEEEPSLVPVVPILVGEEERARLRLQRRRSIASRKRRTRPPSAYPTSALDTASLGENIHPAESQLPPRLILDLPAHRALNNEPVDRTVKDGTGDGKDSTSRRRLLQTSKPQVCGGAAREASQLYPEQYPASAAIGPGSRVVITGALSQIGMELVLQLHELCGVQFIVGIDGACPNTRHDRMETIETRYKYIQRRVPTFRRLMVPVFGIHPDPNLGEEVRFESIGEGFDLVRRLKPTHIVHLAGMEEGRGEYTDYGVTEGNSPFAETGERSMMRRFESSLSMDQVLSSLARFNESAKGEQPQLVYVSSVEANDESGVSLGGWAVSSPASVYGTSSLVKEVLASSYYRNHGVNSVGLRVPTIIGPFSRPGSFLYNLAEHTVRSSVEGAQRKNLSALSRQKEEVAYVYDVASTIIAALQYKSPVDQNGPTLMRIGSKLTTSMKDLKERMEEYLPPADPGKEEASIALAQPQQSVAVISSPGISIFDAERGRDLLGWSHKTGLDEGIKASLAWQVLKAYPYGLAEGVSGRSSMQSLLEDSKSNLSYHSLPCAAGCRWGGGLCSPSPWDEVIETTKEITDACRFVIYTVDLRAELEALDKQPAPSSRQDREKQFCKIAFVSSSSGLVQTHYENELAQKIPVDEWNGKNRQGEWIVVAVPGTHESMPEYERSMAKIAPHHLFSETVEMAMYINHRRIVVNVDQAVGVIKHMHMAARRKSKRKIEPGKMPQDPPPPHPNRHSLFFTNKFYFSDGRDTGNVGELARFVMAQAGIAETLGIRQQRQFYEQAAHLTRSSIRRSPRYQQFIKDNSINYDFIRSTWLVHNGLRSAEATNLRCDWYEEHSLWGNRDMEDLALGYVLAKRRVLGQLGQSPDPHYGGPEKWYAFLKRNERDDDEDDGPEYLEYLESNRQVVTDPWGEEYWLSFLPQKPKKK